MATIDDLKAYLTLVDTTPAKFGHVRADRKYQTYEGFILAEGTAYQGVVRPVGLYKRPDKRCYENSFKLAERHGLQYVEGFAVAKGSPIAVNHAWCFDPARGVIVDPTWAEPEAAVYMGVNIDLHTVRVHMLKTRVWGVIGNDWVLDLPILRYGTILPPAEVKA